MSYGLAHYKCTGAIKHGSGSRVNGRLWGGASRNLGPLNKGERDVSTDRGWRVEYVQVLGLGRKWVGEKETLVVKRVSELSPEVYKRFTDGILSVTAHESCVVGYPVSVGTGVPRR